MREIGGAAWDLYEKERDQLRRRLAEQLRAQMGSIVGDREHADLLLVAADGRKLAAHRCILRQRAPGFYMRHVDPTVIAAKEFPSDQLLEVAVGDVDFAGLEFFIRSVYTDDEVEHLGAAERRHENDYDRDGSASRTSQHTYTMDDPPSTDDFDNERMPDEGTTEGAGDGTPMCGDSMAASEMSSASLRDDGGLLPLAQQVAAAPPTMTSFRQLACESPKKERPLGDVTPDSITQFVLSPDAVAPESPPTAADQMMGKFIRLDDIKDEEPMPVTTTQEKKQIFPMFIGLDLPTRPVSLGRELLPSVMTQSLPSPVNEPLSVRGRALAKRLSVTSLNSLTSIDISPSREAGIFVEMRQARAPPPRLSSLNRTYKRSVSAGVPMGGASFYDRARSLERPRPLMVIPQVPETPEGRESKEREQSPRQMPAPAPAPSSPPSQQVVASQQIVVPQQVIASQPIVAPQQTVVPQQVAASQEVIVPQQIVASQKILVTQQVVAPSPPPAPTSEQPAAPSEPVVQQAVAPIEPPASTAPPKQAQPPPPIDDPTPRETVVASSQPLVTGSPKSNKENKVAKKVPPAQTAPSAQPKLERQGTHTIIPAPAHPREQPVTTAAASVAKQDKPKSVVKPMPFVQAQPPPAPAAPSPKVAAPSPKVAASSPKVAASSPKVAARKSTITTPPANPTSTPKISKTNNNTNIASRAPAVRSTTASHGLKTKRPLTVESANKGPTTELARREPSTASKIPRSPKTVRKSPPPVPVPVSVPVPISTDT
uniref:BTB domain-containing protein n=1 Tax=Plectus sambesii TaxID=2011161 RepID=A0A914UMT1_9BILA